MFAIDRSARVSEVIPLSAAADEFLAQRRIAVAGVSRDPKQPANLIYRRLRDTGHEVYGEGIRGWNRGGMAAR